MSTICALTKHEDGWIYGVFCSESKDTTNPDLSAAVAQAGIVRTHDLQNWERLDNLETLTVPAAEKRGASPGVCGRQIRLLYPPDGRFHRNRKRRRNWLWPLR